MPIILFRHKVGDINTWLKGHQDRVNIFAPAISGFKTFQDTDGPSSVIIVAEVTDMELLAAIINEPENVEVKNRHTVIERIIMSMEVELQAYVCSSVENRPRYEE